MQAVGRVGSTDAKGETWLSVNVTRTIVVPVCVEESVSNSVELLGFYGGDKEHAMSAWTSTARDYEGKKDRMPELLGRLAREGHHTPFEKSLLHFLLVVDTASHIHIIKHRIGVSVNGESARYKELKEDKYYIPPDWPLWAQVNLENHMQQSYAKYHEVLEALTPTLGRKRAKESARFFLPYSNQLTLDVSFNFRSFMHFLGLRKKPEAQDEIHDISNCMLTLVRETGKFEHSLRAFGY
jgi:flavin-dependent thymidylate synthase